MQNASRDAVYAPASMEKVTDGDVHERRDALLKGRGLFGTRNYTVTEVSGTQPSELMVAESWVSSPQTEEQTAYAEAESVYRSFVYDAYTAADEKLLPVLNRLFWQDYDDENDGVYSALSRIREVLKAQVRYSETAEAAPDNADPIAYFLTNSRKGNAVLYASATVQALRAHGIKLDYERDYEPCHFSMEEGYDAMVRLVMRSPDLTAVFALGDAIALGAMRAVFDMGLSIPGDLSLVGFDGVNSSQFSIPRLTTIRQDTRLIATRSVETLLACLGGETKPVREMVPFQLLKRESVRALSPEDCAGSAPAADGGDDASNAVAATVDVSAGRAPETAKAGRTRARASRIQVSERRGVV